MAIDAVRTRSEQVKKIAKAQAGLSRGGGIGLRNKDRIKLSLAHIENVQKANRLKALEQQKRNQSTDESQ